MYRLQAVRKAQRLTGHIDCEHDSKEKTKRRQKRQQQQRRQLNDQKGPNKSSK